MGMWDQMGTPITTKQKMTQDLAGLEEQNLDSAYSDLLRQQRQRAGKIGGRQALSSPGSKNYFRQLGNTSDTAFLSSMIDTGHRPGVRVGYTDTEGQLEGQPPLKGGPFPPQHGGPGVQGGPFRPTKVMAEAETVPPAQPDELTDLRQLLQEYRLRQEGF